MKKETSSKKFYGYRVDKNDFSSRFSDGRKRQFVTDLIFKHVPINVKNGILSHYFQKKTQNFRSFI